MRWKIFLNFVLGGLSVVLIIGGLLWFFLVEKSPDSAIAIVGGLVTLFGWFQTREDKKEQAQDNTEIKQTIADDGNLTRETITSEHEKTRHEISSGYQRMENIMQKSTESSSGSFSIDHISNHNAKLPDWDTSEPSQSISAEEFVVIVEKIRNIIIAYVTTPGYNYSNSNKREEEDKYQELRSIILSQSDKKLSDLIPRFLKSNETLSSLNTSLKADGKREYDEKREFIHIKFASLIQYCESKLTYEDRSE